jgi:hypothetical protein
MKKPRPTSGRVVAWLLALLLIREVMMRELLENVVSR